MSFHLLFIWSNFLGNVSHLLLCRSYIFYCFFSLSQFVLFFIYTFCSEMADDLQAPLVLSTPAEYCLFQETTSTPPAASSVLKTDHELGKIYEINRTALELANGKWRRIALQFPDAMLPHSTWVVEALKNELKSLNQAGQDENPQRLEEACFYILADTSYGACCVDETAAEHVDADVVIHYGRACLSPTIRLPIIYVFTKNPLSMQDAIASFRSEIPSLTMKAIIAADVMYQDHVPLLCATLRSSGYTQILETCLLHSPTGKIPNRSISTSPSGPDLSDSLDLAEHTIFHIGAPPTALLLTLSSRVKHLHVLSVDPASGAATTATATSSHTFSSAGVLLRRRFARLLAVAGSPIIGILVNTLSISNFLPTIAALRELIASAGKKSYTVVVGKLNPAKLANFAEVGGWVVVGCWETSLVDADGTDGFYKPVITPFELQVGLGGEDGMAAWGKTWWAGIEGVREAIGKRKDQTNIRESKRVEDRNGEWHDDEQETQRSGSDSDEAPEFDLRTGKLVSRTRPMKESATTRSAKGSSLDNEETGDTEHKSLFMRTKGDVATIKGMISPGAEFLRTQRTWTGLGSDFTAPRDEGTEHSTVVEEGRSGIARGYTVREEAERR